MLALPLGHESTLEDLELKMKDLELRLLGRDPLPPVASPFTPHSSLEARISKLKEGLRKTKSIVSAKLPSIPLPEFDGTDLPHFLKDFERWLRLSGVEGASEALQLDWLVQCSTVKVKKIVERVVEEHSSLEAGALEAVLLSLAQLFPNLENDITLRESLERLPSLPAQPEPAQVKRLLIDFEEICCKLSQGALSDQERFLCLSRKLHPRLWQELRQDRYYKRRTESYNELKACLLEKSQEDWLERHLLGPKKAALHTLSTQESPQTKTDADTEMLSAQASFPGPPVSQGKGRGKGRGKGGFSGGRVTSQSSKGSFGGKGAPGKGKGRGKGSSPGPPHFQATVWCKFCGKKGHYVDDCWTKKKKEKAQVESPQGPLPHVESQQNDKKRKLEAVRFMRGSTLTTEVSVGGKKLVAIVDSGATTSAIASHCVPQGSILRSCVVPIQVGNGETVFSEGCAELSLSFGDIQLQQSALVVPTTAFQAVLGMDFLSSPRVGGLLTQPPPCRLLVDGQTFPLSEHKASHIHRIYRLFKRESYTLVEDVREEVLRKLDVDPSLIEVDLFANHKNFQHHLYCTRENSSFYYDWSSLSSTPSSLLWANPPFSQMERVLTKVALEPQRIIMVAPDWGDSPWRQLLEKLSVSQVQVSSGLSLYKSDGSKRPLPSPSWNTLVSVLDSSLVRVPLSELDTKVVKWVQKQSRGWDLPKLCEEVRKYPRPLQYDAGMEREEREVQTETPEEDFSSPPVSPISRASQETFLALGADLSLEVDLDFTKKDFRAPPVVHSMEEVAFGPVEEDPEVHQALPSSGILATSKDLENITLDLLQHLPVQPQGPLFHDSKDTENLHGDVAGDLAKFSNPELRALLNRFLDIFGPLPPPGFGCQLVECHLELKEECKNKVIRGRCWPMSHQDQEEIHKQINELAQNGLIEPYPKGKTPTHCSPTFLVEKKESATKRMVGQFKKVNEMTKCHSGFLPCMENMVENLASCRWKSKLDLRSGFWQVGMSEKAKELTAIVVPNGTVWRWRCMPFGLHSAPAIFQEMMEKVISEVKENPKVAELLSRSTMEGKCFMGAFFDDVGVGASTIEEHMFLLEELFKVVQKHKLRIKLSKCDLIKEDIEYLGFSISWGTWRPSESKVQALQGFKVRSLKDLRQFLGACNFFRRHMKNFTFSSAPLTDLLKKNARFSWSDTHEALVEEIKKKLVSSTPLGVPRATGELILITDASDLGGVPSFNGNRWTRHKFPPVFQQVAWQRMVRWFTITHPSFVWFHWVFGIGNGVKQGHGTPHLNKSCWRECSSFHPNIESFKTSRSFGFQIMRHSNISSTKSHR